MGWFPFRRRVQVQAPNPPPEAENRNPNPNPDDGAAAAAEESDQPGQMVAVLVPPHRVSVVWTAWVFFKTFFSSLIPEVPQGMAN